MSPGFVSRWAVRQVHAVAPGDVDAAGAVTAEAIDRWIGEACDEYLASCGAVRAAARRLGLEVRHRTGGLPPGGLPGRPSSVTVSASATEVRPRSFTLAVRLRSHGPAGDASIDTSRSVRLEDPATGAAGDLGDAVRDELIAIEQSARHVG